MTSRSIATFGAVFVAAFVGRLPSFGALWCLDDWGQLGRSAGFIPGPEGIPARFISQHLWWYLTWPVLGTSAFAHAFVRLLLHALAAVMVVRIARKTGVSPIGQLLAGLLFAASPVAFSPLYWASGIQELLAGFFALLAVDRWLAKTKTSLVVAALAAALAILSKESALGLPILFGVLAARDRAPDRRLRLSIAAGLAILAALECVLVANHFDTSRGRPYELGGALVWLGNLGKFGWWLPTPGPVFTAQVTWPMAAVGICVWLGWAAVGLWRSRSGRYLILGSLLVALASVVPALPLLNQARPYMAYLASAALALALGSLVPRRRELSLGAIAMGVVLSVAWGQFTMRDRLEAAQDEGGYADPVVRATREAREVSAALVAAVPVEVVEDGVPLMILQLDLSGDRRMDDEPHESPKYTALSGAIGATLVLGLKTPAYWGRSLDGLPPDAFVVVEKATGFEAWGRTYDALLYAAELAIVTGGYADAVDHLKSARALRPGIPVRPPAPDRVGLPREALKRASQAFDQQLMRSAIEKKISGEEYLEFSAFLAER